MVGLIVHTPSPGTVKVLPSVETAAPFSISQGGRNYHETMFVQISDSKVSFEKFIGILDDRKTNEVRVVLSSEINTGRLLAE